MKKFLLAVTIAITAMSLSAQIAPSANYDRSSITTIFLNCGRNSNYDHQLKEAAKSCAMYGKFDNHLIDIKSLDLRLSDKKDIPSTGSATKIDIQDTRVITLLQQNQVPNKIVLKWWDADNEEGHYSTKVIEERGLYNATDKDVQVADASKRGRAMLKDYGEQLIANSYILVVDFTEIKTMEQVYNETDASRRETARENDTKFTHVKRDKTGFQGHAIGSVYKIDWNDTLNYEIWTAPYYDAENDKFNVDEMLSKELPVSFLARFSVSTDGSQYKDASQNPTKTLLSDHELFVKMYNAAVTNTLVEAPRHIDAFKVKTGLVSKKPLEAKIGKKEGLSIDQRYFVFENRMRSNGDIKQVRKGVVRAKKITDNRNTNLGETPTSQFYQVAGKRLAEGMLLEQNIDYGLGISIGKTGGAFGGISIRAEANASMYSGYASDEVPPGIKLYGFVGFESNNYSSPLYNYYFGSNNVTFLRYGAGLEKEWTFARNFKFVPFAGIGKESTSSSEIDQLEYIDTYIIDYGLRFGINLRYNIQLFYSIDFINPLGLVYEKIEDEEAVIQNFTWTEVFPERTGSANEISLRILF